MHECCVVRVRVNTVRTSFSAAESGRNRDPWPGFPGQVTRTPAITMATHLNPAALTQRCQPLCGEEVNTHQFSDFETQTTPQRGEVTTAIATSENKRVSPTNTEEFTDVMSQGYSHQTRLSP